MSNSDFKIEQLKLISYSGNEKNVVIPAGVKEIAPRAFSDDCKLEEVTVPNSVCIINDGAFCGCKRLKKVIIESYSKLSKIGLGSFYECHELESINLECCSKLEFIGEGSFIECNKLEKIVLPQSLKVIDKLCFGKSGIKKVLFASDSELSKISEGAFFECRELNSINIECCSKLEYIGLGCFGSCKKLEKIVFPQSLKVIENVCFGESGIKNITITSKVQHIGEKAFYKCEKLREVVFDEYSSLEIIPQEAFSECRALEKLTFPENCEIKQILFGAFSFCGNLKQIIFPKSLETIEDLAFSCCTTENGKVVLHSNSLEKIVFPRKSHLKKIGTGAFYSSTSLKSVTVPTRTQLLADAFHETTRIKRIKKPIEVFLNSISVFAFSFIGAILISFVLDFIVSSIVALTVNAETDFVLWMNNTEITLIFVILASIISTVINIKDEI